MSTDTIRQEVAAPTRTPYQYGLFSVLDFQTAQRGSMRVDWDSIGCLNAAEVIDQCLDSTDGADYTKTATVACETPGTIGFSVMAYDDSSLGRDREAASARAREKLLLTEQYVAEVALINAMQAQSPTDVTETADLPLFGGPQVLVVDTALAAVGQVEAALNARGGEGIILLHRTWAPFVSSYVSASGSMMRTKLGTPVAFMAGWTSGPDGSNPFNGSAVGVNAVVAQRGQVEEGNAWDTDLNDHSQYAARDYAFGWECDAVYSNSGDIA